MLVVLSLGAEPLVLNLSQTHVQFGLGARVVGCHWEGGEGHLKCHIATDGIFLKINGYI